MANLIKHKTNGVASVKPLAGDISLGELAINTADGLIFLKKIDGTIVEVGAGGDMLAANNLSDLLDVAAARTNLNVDIAGNAAAMAIALG